MRQMVTKMELVIRKVVPEDSGIYTCVCPDQKSHAIVKIKGMKQLTFTRIPHFADMLTTIHLMFHVLSFTSDFQTKLEKPRNAGRQEHHFML